MHELGCIQSLPTRALLDPPGTLAIPDRTVKLSVAKSEPYEQPISRLPTLNHTTMRVPREFPVTRTLGNEVDLPAGQEKQSMMLILTFSD